LPNNEAIAVLYNSLFRKGEKRRKSTGGGGETNHPTKLEPLMPEA
jgi:hypothetical protein